MHASRILVLAPPEPGVVDLAGHDSISQAVAIIIYEDTMQDVRNDAWPPAQLLLKLKHISMHNEGL